MADTGMIRYGEVSKKRKFVADGVFYAELNELLMAELGEEGYGGVEVRNTPARTEIILRATKPADVLGEKGRRIRELTTVVQNRFRFAPGSLEMFVERVNNRGLNPEVQAESLRQKLLDGLPVRRACYGVIRFILEAGAKGVEVKVGGKLRGARAKGMKFNEGYMIKTGQSNKDYVRTAVRHVVMRQGVLGLHISIMLPHDPTGVDGPTQTLADVVEVSHPKNPNPLALGVPARRPAPEAAPAAAAPVAAAY